MPAVAPDLRATWGNDEAMEIVRVELEAARRELSASDGPAVLVGASMGALTALNYALRHPDDVACLLLALPIVDLAELHGRLPEGDPMRASIEAAHGGAPDPGTWPLQQAPELARIPQLLWISRDDPVGSSRLARRYARAVGAQVHSLGRAGHVPYGGDARVAARFVASVLDL